MANMHWLRPIETVSLDNPILPARGHKIKYFPGPANKCVVISLVGKFQLVSATFRNAKLLTGLWNFMVDRSAHCTSLLSVVSCLLCHAYHVIRFWPGCKQKSKTFTQTKFKNVDIFSTIFGKMSTQICDNVIMIRASVEWILLKKRAVE